nr:MAG TPA: crystallin beta/gamma motif-containing protein [Caudoviricetes sp.]
MADYTFDTSGDLSDAFKIKPVEEETQEMVVPSAEETAERHEEEAQQQAANEEKIGEIIASGKPVRRPRPDLLTTPSITGDLNYHAPEEKPEWQKAAEWVVDSARDIWRNLFNENAQVLSDAEKYAPMLGVSAQYMVDHPELLDETKKRDTLLTINDFLPGNNWFSPETLDKYYPELAEFRQENPVGAALALRNHRDLNDTRSIFERIGDAFDSAAELFGDAFNSGSDMVKLYDAQMRAVNGEDMAAVKPEVDEITQRLKEYQEEDRPTTALGKVVYDTIQQLTIYGTQGLRALEYVPKGMALAMATAAPAAAAAGPETFGIGTAGILAAAGATGAAWGLRTGLFKEISKQSMADRYWEMASQKDANGQPLYSRANMLADSTVVGALNGAVELGLLEFGYGPIKAAFGKDAAKSILSNAAAQKEIVDQGKLALAKMAALAGAKQYARGTASELTEEAVQSVIGDTAENIEYGIHGRGKWNTMGDVLNNAVDAMVQAVPAALGMGALGTGAHAVGQYNAMRAIAGLKVDAWREEYRRSVEKQMIEDLVANKSENNLAKASPQTYQNVVQAQADQHDMGTIYVDAQELARTPEGVNVLNDVVEKGMATPGAVDSAIQNGTDLEIKTGVFAQLADESFDTDTLMDASTMNQGGTHLAALRERKKRMDELAQELKDIANNRSDAISEEIMADHFADADEAEQAAARDVVYRNPYDLQASYKEALKEARQQYEDAVNFKYYWTYKPQGVSIVVADTADHDNVQTGRGYRMSNNEPWYSDMYKEYGGKATKEQMLDVAYKNERAELAAQSPELLPQWDANVEAAKARYEALKAMGDKFEELSKSDYALRKTFSKDGAAVYTAALKTVSQGNPAVSQAAKENAFLYARMAERWAQIRRDYGDTAYTAKDFAAAHPIVIGGKVQNGQGLEQRAWHGSPHDFDEFDLGHIGSGEGFNNHGYGLYFSKSKRIAQDYKKRLGKNIGKLYEVEIPNEKEMLDEDILYKYLPQHIKESIKQAYKKLNAAQKNIFASKIIEEERPTGKENEIINKLKEIQKVKVDLETLAKGDTIKGLRRGRIKKELLKANFKEDQIEKLLNNHEYAKQIRENYLKANAQVEKQLSKKCQLIEKRIQTHNNELRRNIFDYLEETASGYASGRGIYRALSEAFDGDAREASTLLNKNGIKGIIYDGQGEGRCYVVFDDKAIQIIDKYNQGVLRGAYDANTGMLHLLDAANQSTFIHESAHLWLSEMESMAAQEGAPKQLLEDLQTVRDWAGYKKGMEAEYAGTALEKEFAGYAKEIRSARKSGDAVAVKAAEERWMQERFARGFERYIAEGKAPVKELQGPFRRFKKWLVSIYRDLTSLGKEPSDDVRRVMDRMLASDDEIEAWARLRELDAWNRKGFAGDLSGSEGAMIKKWAEKIKDECKEKLLSQYEEEARQRDELERQQGLEEERISYQKQLCAENPIYQYENIYNNMPEARAGILTKLGYENDAEFKQALRDAGGTMEERTDAYIDSVRKTYEEDMAMTPEMIRAEADEMLASTNGQMALNQLETAAMRRKMNGYIAECVKALREVGSVSGTDAEIAAQLRKILGVEYDKNEAQKGALKDSILTKNQQIKDLKKRLAEKDEKAAATKAENDHTIKELKDSLNDVIHGLNQARDMVQGTYTATLRLARQELDAMKVNDATVWRHYEMKAKAASHRADQYMSAGSFEQAIMEKANAQKFYALARAAKDNADYIRRAMAGESGSLDMNGQEIYGIKGILKQLGRTDKPVRMGPHARYFIQHLAYNLGMTDRDGRPPLDKDGNPAPLNWDYIYRDLSPDYATGQDTAPNPDAMVAPWIRAIVDGKDRIQYDKDLTMEQFRDINEAIRAVNKVSRRDYEANTILDDDGNVVAIADAAERLAKSLPHKEGWNAEQEQNDRTRKDRDKGILSDALLSLTKIETLLRNMGPEWMQFIYRPIDKACRRELSMQQNAGHEFARIYHIYTDKEWQHIRSDKRYSLGSVDRFTKEQLLVMALNWGNEEGRQRVLDEANRNVKNEAQKANEATIEDVFARTLTDKDLDFLEAVWHQLDQYWPERNKVQERLYGAGMGRVKAKAYTINGRKVSGGYYPIVYDPQLTMRTNELELDDIVKTQLSGASTMGIGMGSTKKRAKRVNNQIIYKSLDVWPSAVNEAIHHICMREAVTDVYKLVSHPDVEAAVQENYGMRTYAALKQWAKDCWKTDIQKTDKISRMLETMRRNTTFAVMAYRTSTAALNLLNLLPMMHRIGPWNTVKAMVNFGIGFYKGTPTYNRNRRFVMEHSPFMADRINTIDRDIQQNMRLDMPQNISSAGRRAHMAKEAINRYGYFFITETDLMCSLALWKFQYDESLRQQIDAGKTDEKAMRDQALFEADQAVRDVLGSGMVKDQAEIQRKNGLVAQLTPFYSYCNTVMNALIDAGYKWKSGNRMAMFNAMLYWVILNSVFEQLYRSAVSGDDLDKLLKKMGVKMITNTVQGIPVVRDAAEIIGNHMFGLPNYDSGNVLAVSSLDEGMKALKAAKSKNDDATDVARAATRAVNRYVGLSDTLTDGFWALMRFSIMDTDRSVAALANAMIFDRRYKTAKERQQEAKKKRKEDKK